MTYEETLCIQIGEFLPIPCGGTHVGSIKEIGEIKIPKYSVKDNVLRVSYSL